MTGRLLMRVAVCCVSLPLVAAFASSAAAAAPDAAGSGSATVGVLSDAWYAASSACTASPTGCLPAAPPATAYPAKTLHVGAVAGQEESRTYLTLNLTSLPAGTSLTGGSLRVPVASEQDGSLAPDTATLQACAVTGSFKDDVDGSTAAPPAVDCKRATAPAKYVAAAGTAPAVFTVDLSAFATAWTAGATTQGIVLLPASDTAPGSTWHVSMSAHDRQVAAPQHISAVVSYASAAGDLADTDTFGDAVTTPADAGTGSASFAAPPLAPVATNQVTTSVGAAVPVVAPQAPPVAPTQQFQPQAAITVGGFRYPGVFLLPILLAVACGWLARALTRDLQPAAI
jgi:hypothetical protein